MKIDLYTRIALTLICLFLGIIALEPFLQPDPGFAAYDDKFGNMQFAVNMQGAYFFDTRTGEIWNYIREGSNMVNQKLGTVAKMGEPLQ
jgi:hypothetical protein